MNRKKDIIKIINQIAGKYSAYEVFSDWICCSSLAISNSLDMVHGKVWEDRERMYIDTMRKYTLEERMKMVEMLHLLVETLEEEIEDVLGAIYMESGMGNKSTGQFFTPFHLSKMCASVSIPETNENGKIIINEPSCGGGGMIIATAAVLKEQGANPQAVLEVVAQDLDWKGVYMCHLQLSLLGISAVCVQGNTLMEPYDPRTTPKAHILITPRKAGLII